MYDLEALMRVVTLCVSALFYLFQSSSPTLIAQQDPQAAALLRQSIAAMATTVPADSSATGSVSVTEGSTTESGTIQILTRGSTQTLETITLPSESRSVIYSNGDAKEVFGTQVTNPPLETIITDQCVDFPLAFLVAFLNAPDASYRYLGAETLNGVPAQHIQTWNSLVSKPQLQQLASFSLRDIWLDAKSNLPLKVFYFRRVGTGAVPAIPVEISFSNYIRVSNVLYPSQIQKSFNGTPWQTITIQSVSFGVGLTDSNFSTRVQ